MRFKESMESYVTSVLLVVDDESAIRHAFRRVFTGNEDSVLTAATAGEAVDIVEHNFPDVVVLNVQLPQVRLTIKGNQRLSDVRRN